MRCVSIIAALATVLSAIVFTGTAKASWRSSFLMGEKGGYCSNGLWAYDIKQCPENRGTAALQTQRHRTSIKAAAKSGRTEYEFDRSLFSGSEAHLAEHGWLNRDCTILPSPDVRIITSPKKGSLRLEHIRAHVPNGKSAAHKNCYGKPVNAIQVYYRADEKASGRDNLVIDVDTKLGWIFRYTYLVDIEQPKATAAKAEIPKSLPETHLERSVLTKNEARVAAFNYVNVDCSSGPLPDVRIVTAPKNGSYRLEETSIPINRSPGNNRAACNGKPVHALAVYYRSNDAFAGVDEMVVDADFHDGNVRRYIYAIAVQ